ncbi:AI-2E family transporter [Erysipelothrix urinaevulpis]|uniref:AI-2E family transporter n=1 Tax=Erysipelothrix urinaevulpis TaxID=2683717 RepID=UPI0013593153|nr:AI-2E family transporter [Erysipelothrix urinaevulpis]
MKSKIDPKHLSAALAAFLVLITTLLFYLAIVKFPSILSFVQTLLRVFLPVTTGLVMAYLFNFFLVLYEEKLINRYKLTHTIKRTIGLILTYVTVFLLGALFLRFILPQLLDSLTGIINDIPTYIRDASAFVNEITDKLDISDQFNTMILEKVNEFVSYLMNFSANLIPMIANLGLRIISSIWNIVIGLIISVYLLADKERFLAMSKKSTYALFPLKIADRSVELVQLADDIFGNFLSGKILDSAIIGVLTFVVLLIFKMPYALLVAFIIGVTNIIPFFGPFIGAIPAFFIILFVSGHKAFIFLILIFVIQQIDGNFIGPKILGDSLGISAFWILFSILIGGKLFGFLGMVIGVPLFVFIYTIVKEILEDRLAKKQLPTATDDYR